MTATELERMFSGWICVTISPFGVRVASVIVYERERERERQRESSRSESVHVTSMTSYIIDTLM